jgi:hypothetical protein
MASLPPLPKGAEVVEDYSAPQQAAAPDTSLPPLPKGAEVVQDYSAPQAAINSDTPVTDAPPQQMERGAFDKELISRIKRGDSKQDITDFTATAGYGAIPNINEVLAATRGKHKLPLSSKVVHGDDGPSLHVRIGKFLTNMSHSGALPALAAGVLRAPVELSEGMGQIESRVKGAVTGNDADARLEQFALNQESGKINEDMRKDNPNSGFVGAGEIAGNLAETYAMPLSAVTKYGKIANIGATIAKRAFAGGAMSAVGESHATPEEQDQAIVTGALLTPVMIPVTEKIFTALGAKLGNAYAAVLGNGVGKNIYDASGTLTPYGAVLRARLKSINRDTPDELIDDSLKGIASINPKVMPEDKSVVAEGLAHNENVPLTGAHKSRDAKGIQDFESLQAGSLGSPKGQADAIERNSAIDDSILGNIKSIGTGSSSADASTNAATKLKQSFDKAKGKVDALYEPLNKSAEKITKPEALKAVRAAIYDDFGQGATDTLSPTTKGYISRLNNLASQNKQGTASIRFGDVWKLSRDLNNAVRNAQGEDVAQLRTVKKHVDDFIKNASPDIFEKGSNGVFAQLKAANSANRDFSRTFGQNNVKLSAGRTSIPDQAGKAVQKIVGHVKDATERGEDINPALIETAIFGNGKALDSAGSKQAVNTITRLVKASPEVAPHIKDITVNRIVSQMEDGLFNKSLKPQKAQTVIKQAVEGNRALLSAAGFTDKDITRLQTNAYLASLKIPPVGARAAGSSVTNRTVAKSIAANAFRRTLALALGYAGGHEAGTLAGFAAYGAAEAGMGAAKELSRSRLAAKALSSKAPLQPSKAGMSAGKKVGTVTGAQISRSATSGD